MSQLTPNEIALLRRKALLQIHTLRDDEQFARYDVIFTEYHAHPNDLPPCYYEEEVSPAMHAHAIDFGFRWREVDTYGRWQLQPSNCSNWLEEDSFSNE